MLLRRQFVVAIILCVSNICVAKSDAVAPSDTTDKKMITGKFQINLSTRNNKYNVNVGITQCGTLDDKISSDGSRSKSEHMLKGDRGEDDKEETKCKCTHGAKGEPGEKGPKGEPGEAPEPVRPGLDKEAAIASNLGTLEKPANSCSNLLISGSYYINPSKPMEVKCNVVQQSTCLIIQEKNVLDMYKSGLNFIEKEFWLSSRGFNVDKFYGIDVSQIKYLLDKSVEVRQTIRYHCMNTAVNKNNETVLQILTWNDHLIEDKPTNQSPMYYTIVNDGCKEASSAEGTEWKYTDIELNFKSNTRLPVMDFYIRDIRGALQKVNIELRELCFYREYTDSED